MKRFVFYILAFVFITGCDEMESDFQDPNINNIESPIIGAWKSVGTSNKTYYFLNNGEGYIEKLKKSSDGILRNSFDWNLVENLLTIKFHKSDVTPKSWTV